MRRWRVGSFSMGGALVFLGVFLLLQQFFGWDPALVLMSWWPVLFVILGIEILLYLFIAKDENSRVRYDFISIIFIAFIGTTGIGLAVLHSSGLFDFAQKVVSAEVRELDLPKYEESQLQGVERVQVDTGPFTLAVETTKQKEISLFGTYTGEMLGDKSLLKYVSDYAMIEKKGDTLYIKLKDLPHNRFYQSLDGMNATLLIPQDIALELKANWQPIKVTPRKLLSNWNIDGAETLYVHIDKQSDLMLDAEHTDYLDEEQWDQVEKDGDDQIEFATKKYGKGAHQIKVQGANRVYLKDKE